MGSSWGQGLQLLLLLLPLLESMLPLVSGQSCPYGWMTWRSHCYYFEAGRVTYMWRDAENRCEAFDGAAMIYLESVEEQAWVIARMKEFEVINENSAGWWMGLSNTETGEWQWIDGTPANDSLVPWKAGEPGSASSRCAFSKDGEVVADLCDRWKRIVCKRSKEVPVRCESDKGWLSMNGSCYKAFNARKTWQEASDACQMEEAMLVTITTEETQGFIWDLASVEVGDLWSGLHIQGSDSGMVWRWQTSEPMEAGSTFWVPGEPGQEKDWSNKRCAVVRSRLRRLYSWQTANCQDELSFVCQKPQGRCPDGWLTHQAKCYKFYGNMASLWNNAELFCRQRGGTLMKIQSQSDQTFINAYLEQQATAGVSRIWLGITDYSLDDQDLRWSDGSAIIGYTNWAQGFPTNVKDRQDCAFISTDSSEGLWVTSDCEQRLSFACMIPVNKDLIQPAGVTTPAPLFCEEGWKLQGNQCFYANHTEVTWLVAKATCQEWHGNLVTLDTDEVQTFVNSIIGRDSYWIGLNDRSFEGEYKWLTPSNASINATFRFWAAGMPRNSSEENCVVVLGGLDMQRKGQWYTVSCNSSQFFVCQAPAQKESDEYDKDVTQKAWGYKCGPFWEDNPNSEYCYQASSEMLTWQDARDTCIHHGGDLASIATLEEQYFVSGLLVKQETLGVWIGANDLDQEAGWEWIDGEPFSYLNWAKGEPNNIGREQDCAAMGVGSSRWYDLECSLRNGYVCKKRGNVQTTTPKSTPASTVPPGYSVGCPGGWLQYRGVCYWLARDKISWMEASDQCAKKGAALASVTDMDHNNFLLSQLPKASCEDVHSNATQCSVWARQGECQVNPIWMSKNCHAACGLCKHVCRDKHTSASCRLWATVGECHRNPDWMHVWCSQSCGVCNEGLSDAVWIGLNSLRVSRNYEWVNGDRVAFTNWALNEPNNNQDEGSNCVKMYTGTGQWSDEKCESTSAGYVCQAAVLQMKETSEPPIKQGCNQTGLGFNHLCYSLVEKPASWADALNDCESRGGTLATISDRFVQAFLAAELSADTELYWVGLTDTNSPGTYAWTSGFPLQYTAWSQRHDGTELNTCVAMQSSRPVGLWINANCGQALSYVCESLREGYTAPTIPPSTLPTTPASGAPTQCQDGWQQYGSNCYQAFSDKPVTWLQAQEACTKMEATLISIHDNRTGVFLQDNFQLLFDRNYWTGLSDIGRESGYVWQDGTPFDFSAWSEGEPNDVTHRENCVEVIAATARWNDAKCSSLRYFFCARPADIKPVSTTSTTTTEFSNATCDDEGVWTLFEGMCYSASLPESKDVWSYQMATLICRGKGGTLASVHSRRQNDFLVALVRNNYQTKYWLGYNDFQNIFGQSQKRTWEDNSFLDFVSWEPNGGFDWDTSNLCVVLDKVTGLWSAKICMMEFSLICQKPAQDATPTPTPPPVLVVTTGGCPGGLSLLGSKCVAETSFSFSLPWDVAVLTCKTLLNGSLLTMENPDEYDLLYSLMEGRTENVWLGMRTDSSERFVWARDRERPLKYTNWAGEYPKKSGSQRRCVVITPFLGWEDHDCNETAVPICQVERVPSLLPTFPSISDAFYPSYTRFLNRLYRLHQTPRSFADARAACQSEDAELVSVRSLAEDSFIKRLTFDLRKPYWLGGREVNGVLEWVSGDPMTFKYTNYVAADAQSSCLSQNGKSWALLNCGLQQPFICAVDYDDVSTDSTSGWKACRQGFVEYMGMCYLLVARMPLTWGGARSECRRRGMTLATFHQPEQFHGLIDSGQLLPQNASSPGMAWIGLSQMMEGGWYWADGEALLYDNWRGRVPSSYGRNTVCGLMDLTDGKWTGTSCALSKPFICQQDGAASSSTAATTTSTPSPSTLTRVTTAVTEFPRTEGTTTSGASNSSQPNSTYWPGGLPFHPAVEPPPSISKKSAEPLSAGQIVGIFIGVLGLLVIIIVIVIVVRARMNMKGSFYVSPPGGFENALYSKGDESLAIQN